MRKFIDQITGLVPHSFKQINIDLKQQNLIITGANGSGKTALLVEIHKKLNNLVRHKKHDELPELQNRKKRWQGELNLHPEGSAKHAQAINQISHLETQISSLTEGLNITVLEHLEFAKMMDQGTAVIELFPAVRQSAIQEAKSASGINYDTQELKKESFSAQIGNKLEQHLVNLYTRRSFSLTDLQNPGLAEEISKWLSNFDANLKLLLEDSSAKLSFDADGFKFRIVQNNKNPYTFQNLSSGYSSIFHIFSALLMRAEYLKISPSKLHGVALIDEIDAHLHVTLQRKILPFLTDSFPEIQFITTTHSPFVLTSVSNSIIFDITKNEQTSDMSSYSYESVLDGLFDTPPTSEILRNKISQLAILSEEQPPNRDAIALLLKDISPNAEYLDEESRFFFNKAKSIVLKSISEAS